MNIIEFIGFIISMVAMAILLLRKVREERRRRQHPEEFQREQENQEAAMKDFLKSLEIDVEDEDNFSPPAKPVKQIPAPSKQEQPSKFRQPPRTVQDDFHIQTAVEKRKFKTSIENRQFKHSIDDRYLDYGKKRMEEVISKDLLVTEDYQVIRRTEENRVNNILKRQKSPQDMVVLYEIFGPPKCLRDR